MSTVDLTREQLAQYILNTAKESSISKIRPIVLKEQREKIIAYSVDGKPLNEKEYVKEVEVGMEDIKAGRVITDDDLSKERGTW